MNIEKIQFEENIPFKIKMQSLHTYPIHWHENVTEIILPLDGAIKVTSNFESTTINDGEFWFINNKSIHSITSIDSSPTVVALFHINLDYFETQFKYINYMFFRTNSYPEKPTENQNILFNEVRNGYKIRFRNLLINLASSNLDKNTLDIHLVQELAYQLTYSMVYEFNWLKLLRNENNLINSSHLDRYHRIVKFIHDNYDHKITLNDIVSKEFITKTYFSHFWKGLSSYSFKERVNYERVLKSEFLLILTDMNISDISEKCGFSDVKYYYQNFKKWYRCMPLEHRLKCFNYSKTEFQYEDLCQSDYIDIFSAYSHKYLVTSSDNYDFTNNSFVENYVNILNKNIDPATSNHISLDIFNCIHFYIEDDEIFFNWHDIDSLVNLSLRLDCCFHIKFSLGNIHKSLISDISKKFIELCLHRYGLRSVSKWYFSIIYKNTFSFNESSIIFDFIYDKLPNAKLDYYFEF